MSKRKPKKGRKPALRHRKKGARRSSVSLEETLDQADRLLRRDRAESAIELLEPLLTRFPRAPDLHYSLGYARVKVGDIWGGLASYERALELSRDPRLWETVAYLCLELELTAHALHAFRQVLKRRPDASTIDEAHQAVAALEQDIQATARGLDLPTTRVEEGLRFLEDGQQALQRNDFSAAIADNQRAIKRLGDWPPPHNNLSLALFFDGEPEEAIATARAVLSRDPLNIQALSNAIRFLAWTGQEAEARSLWSAFNTITPQNLTERFKMAEAAAVLEEDHTVYQLLKPLDQGDARQTGKPQLSIRAELYLAAAEANLGKRTARRRLERLRLSVPWAREMLAALKAGQPGPGWSDRFPHFQSTELLPMHRLEQLIELISRQDDISPKRFRKQMTEFATRFPQIVMAGEKWIWEEGQPDAGIGLLAAIATPAALAALHRFGLSQAGDDDTRMQALVALAEAGEIAEDETLRIWSRGEWREVQLRQYKISDEQERDYAPRAVDLLNQGVEALQGDESEQAERLFKRALSLEPRAKEAYNNLGTIYARRGADSQAKEMFQAALEIDPLYALPRCNLANYLLDDHDVAGAMEMLAPLADATQFHPQEMAFYSYTQARALIQKEEFEMARDTLGLALEVWPGYEPAEQLLEHLERVVEIQSGFDSWFERQYKRDLAKRARLQAKLTSPDPGLSEALSLYTKNMLTGMGRVILPWGGWSALRKAELLERIVGGLEDVANIQRIVGDLTAQERMALVEVLARGGRMPWRDFDAAYGNDMEESPYWEWHEPETTMGRLRLRGLLVETTVDGELSVAVPSDLLQALGKAVG